jgi:peptidoglycan/LPS O-acetylase OafA/YrhL
MGKRATDEPIGNVGGYRRDIDGLRAVAVVPVMLFHYGVRGFPGGFLGVDIFFVISGFLLTQIIDAEINAGRFSIARFYERRVRRIFPALFCMLAAMLAIGYVLYLPPEFVELGRSLVATTLFVSNFFFLANSNYFGPAAGHEPLIHTWSLAVEEQFYVVLPLALLWLRRHGRGVTRNVLVAAALLSLATDAFLVLAQPSAAFYLPVSRVWELLCGSLAALGVFPVVANDRARQLLAAFGLALVAAAVACAPEDGAAPFPLALIPVAGAVLLILTGSGGSLIGRLLAHPLPAYVGRISYSLYLWHWPVWIVYLLAVRARPNLPDKEIAVVVSLVLAACSTRFIERPFRLSARTDTGPPVRVLAAAGGMMTVSVAVGLTLVLTHGLASRFAPRVRDLASYLAFESPAAFRGGTCFLDPVEMGDRGRLADACLVLDPKRRNYLILGDSHAAHLWSGLAHVYPDIHFLQATVASCEPLLDVPAWPPPASRSCRDLVAFMYQSYLPSHHLAGIIVSGRWHTEQLAALHASMLVLHRYQSNVAVVGPMVEYLEPLPRILALSELRGRPDLARQQRDPAMFALDERVRRAVAGTGVGYVSMMTNMCTPTDCRTLTDAGVPMQYDYAHLTPQGSAQVARTWRARGLFESSMADASTQRAPLPVR